MWDPYAECESATLPNGLTVYAAYWRDRPWERIGFAIHSGGAHDPEGLEGLAHFVEHCFSLNGSMSAGEIEAFFWDCGGEVNLGVMGCFSTMFDFFAPTDRGILAKSLSLFGPMLLHATFGPFVERERQVILREFDQYFPTHLELELHRRERRVLFSGDWRERDVRTLGTPESIRRITKEDLQSHYDRHYTPANMSVVAVGGLTLSQLMDIIADSPLADCKEGARTSLPRPITEFAPPLETRYVLTSQKPANVFSYRSVARIPGTVDRAAIAVVREMITWAHRGIKVSTDIGPDCHELSIDIENFPLVSVEVIEKVIDTHIASLVDQPDVFDRVKACRLARQLTFDASAREICDRALGELGRSHRIISLAEDMRDVERLTMADMRSLLQWLRPEWRWTLIKRP